MSEPTTWLMLEHVQAALRLIRVDRGFHTDLGLGVVALEGEQLPAKDTATHIVILAADIPVNEESSTRTLTKSDMEIVVELSIPYAVDENPQRTAHRGRADVIRALTPLRKDIKNRPQGVNSFQITGSSIGTPDDGASVVLAQVTARAGLSESNPPASP